MFLVHLVRRVSQENKKAIADARLTAVNEVRVVVV